MGKISRDPPVEPVSDQGAMSTDVDYVTDQVTETASPPHKQGNATKKSRASAALNPQAHTSVTSGRASSHKRGRSEETLHIDDLLRPLAEKATPPGEEEINTLAKTMAEHLLTCEPCQATLSAIIMRLTEQAEEGSLERARGAQLLQRFNAVLVKARVRKQLGPYAATLYVHGEAAARAEYPEVADHLEQCEACRQEVADRRAKFETQMAEALHGVKAEAQPKLGRPKADKPAKLPNGVGEAGPGN